jgi:hypothetical protein
LGVVWEKAEAHYLAVAEGIDQRERRNLADDVRVPAPLTLIADQDHYLVTRVENVLNVELDVSPRLKPSSPVSPDALMAPIDVCEVGDQVPCTLRRVPFDPGVDEAEVEVAPGKALDPSGFLNPSVAARTISTFSCDIAYSAWPRSA